LTSAFGGMADMTCYSLGPTANDPQQISRCLGLGAKFKPFELDR